MTIWAGLGVKNLVHICRHARILARIFAMRSDGGVCGVCDGSGEVDEVGLSGVVGGSGGGKTTMAVIIPKHDNTHLTVKNANPKHREHGS